MAKRSIFKQIIRNDANSVFLNQLLLNCRILLHPRILIHYRPGLVYPCYL